MEEKVIAVLAETLCIPAGTIGSGTTMEGTSSWDSLRHIELVSQLEDAFGVRFEVEEILDMVSFDRIVAVLGRKETS